MESHEGIQVIRLPEQHAKVIDGRFAVEIIVTRKEKIPRVNPEPGQVVTAVDGIRDRDEFVIALDLYDENESHQRERPHVNDHAESEDQNERR